MLICCLIDWKMRSNEGEGGYMWSCSQEKIILSCSLFLEALQNGFILQYKQLSRPEFTCHIYMHPVTPPPAFVTVMPPCMQASKIVMHENRTSLLELVLLCTTEQQLCEGEMWRDKWIRRRTHRHIHTHTKKTHWWMKWEKELGVTLNGLKTKGTGTERPCRPVNQTPSLSADFSCLLLPHTDHLIFCSSITLTEIQRLLLRVSLNDPFFNNICL